MQSATSELVTKLITKHMSLAEKLARQAAKKYKCDFLEDDIGAVAVHILWKYAEWYERHLLAGRTFEAQFPALVATPIKRAVYRRIEQERKRNPPGSRTQLDAEEEKFRAYT